MCVQVQVQVQRLVPSVFLGHAPLDFLRQDLSINWELADLAKLSGQQAPGTLQLILSLC